ncbi:MAG: HepT-like ribonuclease domain-containing protein, partial [Candidatus Bathyarchaeia archaeon]
MEIINLLSQVVEVAVRIRDIEPKDWLHVYSLRWAIYEALKTLLDACSMIIAELGLRKPSSYAEIVESGFLNSQEAYRLKNMARIRNRVAHTYRLLDPEELKA